MPNTYLLIFSILPFAIFVYLLLIKKMPLLKVALATLALAATESLFYWKITPLYFSASFIKGFLTALDIFFIIFGAIFFLNILKALGIIDNLAHHLRSVSKDYRVQVIILAWFLGNFLEGTAGFGTNLTVVAPLLVGLGLTPLNAVVLALLGSNSAASVFGAAGTPIRVGFAGLEIGSASQYAAFINMIGLIVPVFVLWLLVLEAKNRKEQILEALPFAIFAGLAFVLPAALSVFLGQEFSTILGSIIGLGLALVAIKFKFLLPKTNRQLNTNQSATPKEVLPLKKALAPYGLLILFLILGKFILSGFSLNFYFGLVHKLSFFNPGFAFFAAGLITTVLFWKKERHHISPALKSAFKRSLEPFAVVAVMATFVQLMINAGHNASGILSPLDFLSRNFENSFLPLWTALSGAFGSFLTGSTTISCLMFGNFWHAAAQAIHQNVSVILALGLAGAAGGGVIALSDMLAAEAVVGIKNEERKIIRRLILPCSVYVLLVGLIGLLIV